jgi:hypothetical protein
LTSAPTTDFFAAFRRGATAPTGAKEEGMQFKALLMMIVIVIVSVAPTLGATCETPEQLPGFVCGNDQCYRNQIGTPCSTFLGSGQVCWTKFLGGCLENATYVVSSYYSPPTPSESECARRAALISPCPTGGCPDPEPDGGGQCHEGQFCGLGLFGPAALKSTTLAVAEGVGLLRGTTLFMAGDKSAIVTAPNRRKALVPLVEPGWIARRLARQYYAQIVIAGPTGDAAIDAFLARPGALGVLARTDGQHLGLAAEVLSDSRFRSVDSYLRQWPDAWVLGRLIDQPAAARDEPVTIRPLVVYVLEGGAWTSSPAAVFDVLSGVYLPE